MFTVFGLTCPGIETHNMQLFAYNRQQLITIKTTQRSTDLLAELLGFSKPIGIKFMRRKMKRGLGPVFLSSSSASSLQVKEEFRVAPQTQET